MKPISTQNNLVSKNHLRIYLYITPIFLYALGIINFAGIVLGFIASWITFNALENTKKENSLEKLTKFLIFLVLNTVIWFF